MERIELTWTEIKGIVDSKKLSIQYFTKGNQYHIYAFDGNLSFFCKLEIEDATDFETNYLPSANKNLTEIDSDGRQVTKSATTYKGWRYLAHPVEVETSTLNSLFCEDYIGTTRPGCTLQFFDSNGTELVAGTQLELNLNCVETVLTIAPSYDYDIIGGNVHQSTPPTQDLRIWVIAGATDLKHLPGTVTEFIGGINLKLLPEGDQLETDGRASARLNLTTEGVPTPTNKLQYILRHPVGFQHKLMVVVEYFRA